jgi:hypothetical protein
VVKGGAAERSGCLHPGDEVLEVNGLRLKGKSVHDICSTLCQARGTIQSLSEKELNAEIILYSYSTIWTPRHFSPTFFLLDTNIMPI